ncbi:MAG: PepSY domain-containing protein [Bacteriovoracaceae bacterium]|nr:PepSY domain-containing protein [Bacteriovoracaceae bacterium]
MKRQTIFNIHFYLSIFFAPFLLLIATTGTFYLFGNKGEVESTLIKENVIVTSSNKKEQVSTILKSIDSSYTFEYLKDRGSSIQTRPTTRTYYNFKKISDGKFNLYKNQPNFLLKIIEVHKGHGPRLLNHFQKILGFGLMLIVLSGFFMSLRVKKRLKPLLISMGAGVIVLGALFCL